MPWSPEGFAGFAQRFPMTPPFDVDDAEPTWRFIEHWREPDDTRLDQALGARATDLHVAFVRDFLGDRASPGLSRVAAALRGQGLRAHVLATRGGGRIEANADRIAHWLRGDDAPVLLCGHGKGGLECLRAADRHRALEDRVIGVILCQAPRGPSAWLERLLLGRHREGPPASTASELLQRASLTALGAAAAGRELAGTGLEPTVLRIDAHDRGYPVWQIASWSSSPGPRLAPLHRALSELRPACAHDGVYFLEDLVWPGLPHLLLPDLDHLALAGGTPGVDFVRAWKLILADFLYERGGM